MRLLFWSVLFVLGVAADPNTNCTGLNAISPHCDSIGTPYRRDTFYIGGDYVPYSNTSQSLTVGQVYVEKLTPLAGVNQTYPLVFISAGIPAGSGWASYFVEAGYQVYILDVIGNGRSVQNDLADYTLRFGSTDNITQNGFTAPELVDYYPQADGHDKWPGSGIRGDPVFDAFEASLIPLNTNYTSGELAMRAAGCNLLSLIGKAFTFCHSASCQFTTLMADQCPDLLQATINLEPTVTPFQSLVGNATNPTTGRTSSRLYGLTNTPINYEPPVDSPSELNPVEVGTDTAALRSCFLQSSNSTIHTLPEIAKVPFIMYTGSASPHITYDHCVALYLEQTQVPYEWIKLEDIGIHGNGHFSFLETNNLEIAAVVYSRLQALAA
ncbi:secreted lipase-like protein 1 [Seiridium cupressi]